MNSFQGGDIYRIHDLIETVQVWRPAAFLTCASSSNPDEAAEEAADGRMRARGGKTHDGAMCSAGRPDAAYEDFSKEGRRRPGYVIGLMSSTLSGSRRISQRAAKFTRKLLGGSLGGEAYDVGEMAGHMAGLMRAPSRVWRAWRIAKVCSPKQWARRYLPGNI